MPKTGATTMKRTTKKTLRLKLNVDPVRPLQPPQPLDDTELQQVVGGGRGGMSASGRSACVGTSI
jgi:bacteriocin-like protein